MGNCACVVALQRSEHILIALSCFLCSKREPLMMFLWLIPLAMVDQRPTHLFDVGDSGWKKHLDSLPENTWLDPQNLPNFGQILHHVDSPTSTVYKL